MTIARAEDVQGDQVHFITLADGTPVPGPDDAPQRDGALAPLQRAVEATVERPYRVQRPAPPEERQRQVCSPACGACRRGSTRRISR